MYRVMDAPIVRPLIYIQVRQKTMYLPILALLIWKQHYNYRRANIEDIVMKIIYRNAVKVDTIS